MNDNSLDRLLYMDDLIRRKATGKPSQFAKKLSVSERTLYRWIGIFRNRGIFIDYDSIRETYYYNQRAESMAPLEFLRKETTDQS
jgi:predicted DNA-binding transcriptional regulator YafY